MDEDEDDFTPEPFSQLEYTFSESTAFGYYQYQSSSSLNDGSVAEVNDVVTW